MRATWKGFLKISLVNIPVKVFPATESEASLSFNQLHADCQTRIQQRRWCPKCAREVPNSDIVKGYEFERGKYVVLEDTDVDAVQVPSTRVIDLVQFADEAELDPMYVDRTYYLAPDGQMAGDAFAVMASAMADKIGVGKLAIYGREYLVAVRSVFAALPLGKRTLVLHTLHHAAERRDIGAVDELATVPAAADRQQVQLARQVMEAFEQPLNLADYRDEYRARLQEIVDAKIAGEAVHIRELPPAPPAVNLVDSLKRSLEAIAKTKKPAKVAGKKKRSVA